MAIPLFLILTAACAVGCSSPPLEEAPAPTASATPAQADGEDPDIVVTVASLTPQYSPDRPFVFKARISAENRGSIEGRGVVITVSLIDEEENKITDTKNQYIERFMPGDTKIFDITLANADPARAYRVETGVIFNRP
jgi:hypothetical protein